MTFNAKDHLRKIKGTDYLDVKWRIMWFRDDHPNGNIDTHIVHTGEFTVIVKAIVYSGEGQPLSSAHGTAQITQGNHTWKGKETEKAETAAIGRALAHAGYGTQFTEETTDEEVVDSPVERNTEWATTENINTLVKTFQDKTSTNATASDLAHMAGIDRPANYTAWNETFPSGQAAFTAIMDKYENGALTRIQENELKGMDGIEAAAAKGADPK